MTREKLTQRELLIAAGVVFGRGKDIEEIQLRVDAYEKLLALSDELKDEIDEFDLIRVLEELPSFLTTDQLRKIANELGILERHSNGLIRIKPKLFLDDVLPGRSPTRLRPIPTNFTKLIGNSSEILIADRLVIEQTRRRILQSIPLLLDAAESSPHIFLTPFYKPTFSSGMVSFSYEGTAPASTPFLDLYLALADAAELDPEDQLTKETFSLLKVRGEPIISAYLDQCVEASSDVNSGAFLLPDDEDLPGTTKPHVVANGALLSVLVKHLCSSTGGDSNLYQSAKTKLSRLANFLLAMQNSDGGWPIYRYDISNVRGKGPESPSISVVSLVAFAGLLDYTDMASETEMPTIVAAALKYANWLIAKSQHVSDHSIAWLNNEDSPCVNETAVNLTSCMIVGLMAPEAKLQLEELIKKALRFIDENWDVSPGSADNQYRITIRPPETDGPALLPIEWVSPGHARVLRALSSMNLKRRVFPGFRAVAEMQKAVASICADGADGFARRLNDSSVMEVSTTTHFLRALCTFGAAERRWYLGDDSLGGNN